MGHDECSLKFLNILRLRVCTAKDRISGSNPLLLAISSLDHVCQSIQSTRCTHSLVIMSSAFRAYISYARVMKLLVARLGGEEDGGSCKLVIIPL